MLKETPVLRIKIKSRVDWIRTSDPLHPMQVRYRAAPPPEEFMLPVPPRAGHHPKNLSSILIMGAANVRHNNKEIKPKGAKANSDLRAGACL